LVALKLSSNAFAIRKQSFCRCSLPLVVWPSSAVATLGKAAQHGGVDQENHEREMT
jgi:hypothetical protein